MSQHQQREASEALKATDARQIVDALDQLVKYRIRQGQIAYTQKEVRAMEEEAEILKRQLTDYLLATDPRQGLYVQGEHR